MVAVLNWGLAHWWVLFFLSAFGFFDGVREFFAGIFASAVALGDRRHERRLEVERAKAPPRALTPEDFIPATAARTRPGRCVHRRVRQVRDRDDNLVAWLCAGCEKQLPADWAVAEEDL